MSNLVRQKRLYEEIVDTILHQIDSGQLKSGDRLPTEKQIAYQMNISKTAVREALSALESMGYTKTKKGEGTFVAPMTLESLILPLSIVLYQDANVIKNVLELRLIIEPRIAALAAERISYTQIEELTKIQLDMLLEINKGGPAYEKDFQFHILLAKASGNSVLYHLYALCQSAVTDTIEIISKIPGWPKRGYLGHQDILQAVCDRDSNKAAALMHKHVESLFQIYNKISNNDGEPYFVSAG